MKNKPFQLSPIPVKKDPKNQILKKDFNLLPREILERRQFDEKFKKSFNLSAKILILAALLILVPISQLLSSNLDRKALNSKIEALLPIEEVETEVINSRARLKRRQQVILNINANDSFISVVLNATEKIMPEALSLKSLTLGSEAAKDAEGKAGNKKVLHIAGSAKNKESIADFQKSLKDSGLYQDVFVAKITETDIKQEQLVKTLVPIPGMPDERMEIEERRDAGFETSIEFELRCILNEWK